MFYDEQQVVVEVEVLMMEEEDNLLVDLIKMLMLEMSKLNKRKRKQ